MTFCNARRRCEKAGLSAHTSSVLFEDFHSLQRIWTHPLVLKETEIEEPLSDDERSEADDASEHQHDDDDEIGSDTFSSSSSGLDPETSSM